MKINKFAYVLKLSFTILLLNLINGQNCFGDSQNSIRFDLQVNILPPYSKLEHPLSLGKVFINTTKAAEQGENFSQILTLDDQGRGSFAINAVNTDAEFTVYLVKDHSILLGCKLAKVNQQIINYIQVPSANDQDNSYNVVLKGGWCS